MGIKGSNISVETGQKNALRTVTFVDIPSPRTLSNTYWLNAHAAQASETVSTMDRTTVAHWPGAVRVTIIGASGNTTAGTITGLDPFGVQFTESFTTSGGTTSTHYPMSLVQSMTYTMTGTTAGRTVSLGIAPSALWFPVDIASTSDIMLAWSGNVGSGFSSVDPSTLTYTSSYGTISLASADNTTSFMFLVRSTT